VAYACLAETALLAMDGRFEDYTLGRNISIERVKEIYRLFKKHDFRIAGLRSFEEVVSEAQFAEKRRLAAELKANPMRFAQLQAETGAQLAKIPVQAKGVASRRKSSGGLVAVVATAVGGLALLLWPRYLRP
jgi:hypothetical protein